MTTVVNLDKLNIVTIPEIYAILLWLPETFGPSGTRWKVTDLREIVFNEDTDASLFLLRWE